MSADLWEIIGNSDEMTEQDGRILTEMLTACILAKQRSASIIFGDTEADPPVPEQVFTVFFMERRNAIVGTIFKTPTTTVYAQFKDWLAEGIDEDGTLNGKQTSLPFLPIMSDHPLTEEEQEEAFAAKAQEIQDDEWAMAFDALLQQESERT